MKDFIYARFADGTTFAICDPAILYRPKQAVLNTKFLGNTFDSEGQLLLLNSEAKVLEGDGEYELRFDCKLPKESKFWEESFWVGKIKFMLISYTAEGKCVALGRR